MTRFFVTGGSGFLGRAVIEHLVAQGHEVCALARTARASQVVESMGATAVRGDLSQPSVLTQAMEGVDMVIHMAAKVDEWGAWDDFVAVNVEGTRHVLDAAQSAGVQRVVHVSTEAVLVDGQPLCMVDETAPLSKDSPGFYAKSKALAEEVVWEAHRRGQHVMIVRPRLIWGAGDTTLLPRLVEMAKDGRLMWVGGGEQLTSTCHVQNCVHGLMCVLAHGQSGECYFLTDGEPVAFKPFMTQMIQSQHVQVRARAIPFGVAYWVATWVERLWRWSRRTSTPPVTRMAVALSGVEVTVSDQKARDRVGYRPVISMEEGMAQLAR